MLTCPGFETAEHTKTLLEACAASPRDFIGKLALDRDLPAARSVIEEFLRIVENREDAGPFRANSLLRAWRLYAHGVAFPVALRSRIQNTLTGFVYRDFPRDYIGRHRSENLRLSYMTAEYLTAATWPDTVMAHTQRPAIEHYYQSRNDIVAWTEWVGTYGFLEWDSSTYYGIDLMALLNLYDFAPDAFIRQRAEWILAKLILDIALKTFKGVYGASRGRCYIEAVTDPRHEQTVNVLPFFFGVGELRTLPDGTVNALSGYLATTRYRPPEILGAIARHDNAFTQRQRNRGDDRYYPPPNVPHAKNLNLYTDANLVTHRTPHGMLCSCQDYRSGQADRQSLLWQATLREGAIAFASVPASGSSNKSHPHQELWIDTARQPRIAQFAGTLAALYRPEPDDTAPYSHLYFPEKGFDEVVTGPSWVAGRAGTGYVGIRCSTNLLPVTDGPFAGTERRAANGPAAYVCELGDAGTSRFDAFVRAIANAPFRFEPDSCALLYRSSSAGEIHMGWEGAVQLNGNPVTLSHFPHHDGPLARSEFGSGITELHCESISARLERHDK